MLSYSDGPVKDSEAIGSGVWHVKGYSLTYSHREYPGTHALSGGQVEFLYTLRCLNTIQLNVWEGKSTTDWTIWEWSKKVPTPRGRSFRATTAADTDL